MRGILAMESEPRGLAGMRFGCRLGGDDHIRDELSLVRCAGRELERTPPGSKVHLGVACKHVNALGADVRELVRGVVGIPRSAKRLSPHSRKYAARRVSRIDGGVGLERDQARARVSESQ